jgi:leucyl-tRNA synthetase
LKQIVAIHGRAAALDQARCDDVVGMLRRAAQAQGEPFAEPEPPRAVPVLLALAGQGRLAYTEADGEVEVFYIPSRAASLGVFEGDGFPEPIQKKQADAFRTSQGALFRFPAEQGDRPALEVFITDWSPCPAAAAVAVHRGHPLAADLEKPKGPFFTGRYVRHPLTGDLLPVWVADWVKPDFGTGAVLVNPAHDATDLAFGRAIGLPIRFALVPPGFDGRPETWPAPPVVKTGQSIKTGFWDGLQPQEAMQRYFEALEAVGLAERHRDVQAGRRRVARLVPDPSGDLRWDEVRGRLSEAGAGVPVRAEETELLAALSTLGRGAGTTLVCPAAEQAEELLFLRLLVLDLHGVPLAPERILLVQKVQEAKLPAPPEVLRLGVLVGAPLQQVAVVKQQVVEQVQRFLRVHAELVQAWPARVTDSATAPPKAVQQARTALLEGDPARAFAALGPLQKQLGGQPPEQRDESALAGYLATAHVLAGLDLPAGFDLRRVWSEF